MNFIADLIRWFWQGKADKNKAISQPVSEPLLNTFSPAPKAPDSKKDLDYEPSFTSKNVMGDLQSLQSITQQFDVARQELIAELQRLAPPKKRNPFWDKDAA